MADNIKIVGSILNTTEVSRYDNADLRLITSKKLQKSFNAKNDYIEYHVYDIANNLLNTNYDYRQYKLPPNYNLNPGITSSLNINNTTVTGAEVGTTSNLTTSGSSYPIIEIDPVQDLQDLGYTSGEFKVQYNVFKNKISKFPNADLFIKEISPDRTEIRVGSVVLTDSQLESGSLELINSYSSSSVFDPFLLDFLNNRQEIITNIVLNPIDTGYEILFKLYNELDPTISEKDSLWVVEEISSPYIFNINLDAIFSAPTGSRLRGPRFKNRGRFRGSNTTSNEYKSLDELALNQEALQNLNISQSISININYDGIGGEESGFNSFVVFGSALSRVQNFYNKVQQIENYNTLINKYTPNVSTTSSLQSEINSYTSSINNIITNFDGFENYLYFTSGSLTSSLQYGVTPYPKSGSNKPYPLYPTTSSEAKSWYNFITSSAEDYDLTNVNYFKYSVPGYVVDDPANDNYLTFLNMMGQFFDNIWIYIKSVTDLNVSNNNLNLGISKDIVYNLLQSLGISVFNSFGDQNLANYLIGSNTGSASYSGSLNDFSATSSYLNNIPKKDILAESYKRIYHNLPLLLQRKGTVAGLRTLLSTFGIQNQDYYTVSGSTYYTPTGSALTGSVLNVKEFGGSTTVELLKGYNNDKVRIVNTYPTGNVLSSIISIQQYTSQSSDFRTADDHYVDVSFSPQTQIDTYVSSSISTINPTWVIDDYIGDPRQLYSGSYSDLISQQHFYFNTGSQGGFTASLLDYNGFIRLVQFFDNSLFKMLEDYVPAKASLSTGITINSPVLERNKWSYARPNNSTNELEKDGNIVAPTFDSIYDNWYSNLSGSKVAYINGEISGSRINIYDNYFVASNFNPYLSDINVYNAGKSIYQQANTNNFIHSDFNVLQNNVSRSLYSTSRQKLEISGSSQVIGSGSYVLLLTASLQDSYLSLDSYVLPRYGGVKLSSVNYNTYTSASITYVGDNSYGKTAAIDHYVRKIGLFTQIISSSFFPSRNLTSLKYLIDESGSLTELSQTALSNIDSHWVEVQNTFKLGRRSTVALFDNQQYGDQKTTDGVKPIFDSGYSYYPILYYSGSNDSKLYFQYVGRGNGILMGVNNGGYFITGSTNNLYTASAFTGGTGSIYAAFDISDTNFSIGNSYYYNIRRSGSANYTNNFPTYSISQNANMAFSANFGINISFPTTASSVTYKFDLFYNPTGTTTSSSIGSQTQTFTSSTASLAGTLNFTVTSSLRDYAPGDQVTFQLRQYSVTGSLTSSLASTGDGTVYTGLKNSLNPSGISPFATTGSGQFISGSNSVDTLTFNQSLSSFIDYQYLPATSSVSLHNAYGNVDYTFSPKVGDVILLYYNNNTQYQELNISRVTPGTKYSITVSPNLVSNLASGSYGSNTISKVILLSKVPDETNINLIFDKNDGSTSYGFLIPDNLSPDVLKNIDTITKEVKQKLLSSQAAVTINTV